MTHKSIPADRRRSAGVADSLVRLSVGLEESEDLIRDIEQALEQVTLSAAAGTHRSVTTA